ncbi:hypothetical protein GCM10023195_22630 [Actinoallomurus liliacearum]|uniref:Uncharacterized protein n=1 Tax=Actinoallomurus liliacearum TaxID=1080073 RepID=A0ABP8THX2_9ACTN
MAGVATAACGYAWCSATMRSTDPPENRRIVDVSTAIQEEGVKMVEPELCTQVGGASSTTARPPPMATTSRPGGVSPAGGAGGPAPAAGPGRSRPACEYPGHRNAP